jgi:gamma-glutamylcyclotransferase (GGCT)/AIG2-like uncharacterized protein YtfP
MPSPDSSFLAVYGSLRRRSMAKQGLSVLRNLRFYGHGILRGLLFIQNGYPGALQQPGLIRVEIYRVLSETVWEILDRYEGYLPSVGCRSLFYRTKVTLLHPEIRASVYFLGREIPRGSRAVMGNACSIGFQPARNRLLAPRGARRKQLPTA